jgi:hypothetical protein
MLTNLKHSTKSQLFEPNFLQDGIHILFYNKKSVDLKVIMRLCQRFI